MEPETDFLAGAGESTPAPGHYGTYKLTFLQINFFPTSYETYYIFSRILPFLHKLKEKIGTGTLKKKLNNFTFVVKTAFFKTTCV